MREFPKQLQRLFQSDRIKTGYSARVVFTEFYKHLGWQVIDADYADVVARNPAGILHVLKFWIPHVTKDVPRFFVENFIKRLREISGACQRKHALSGKCTACRDQCPLSTRMQVFFLSRTPLSYEAWAYWKDHEAYMDLILTEEARKLLAVRKILKRERDNPGMIASMNAEWRENFKLQVQKTLDPFLVKTAS